MDGLGLDGLHLKQSVPGCRAATGALSEQIPLFFFDYFGLKPEEKENRIFLLTRKINPDRIPAYRAVSSAG